MKTLKEELQDWTNWDEAEMAIAKVLSIIDPEIKMEGDIKDLFWSTNSLGNFFADVLEQMAENEILEFREEPDLQFKWNNNYSVKWK